MPGRTLLGTQRKGDLNVVNPDSYFLPSKTHSQYDLQWENNGKEEQVV